MPCHCPLCGRQMDCDVRVCDICMAKPVNQNGGSIVNVRRCNGREKETKEIEIP